MSVATQDIHTVIVGASAAGLSTAVCLQHRGIPFVLLEQHGCIGNEWVTRYDRLHLHTTKKYSQLPYHKLPEKFSKYVSKDDFAQYLRDYAKAFKIQPYFRHQVVKVEQQDKNWAVYTPSTKFLSRNVIVATGHARQPIQPFWNGRGDFKGDFLHSSQYKNGRPYRNKKVLVVGFGNSACEIALCLFEHQAYPSLSVRNGVNILPREIAGIPITGIALAERWLTKISPSLPDAINKPILRIINGNISKYGLQPLDYGPMTQIVKHKKIPLLDIGTMDLIKNGKVRVFPGIRKITSDTVQFTDGSEEKFDVIISATGYLPRVNEFIQDHEQICDRDGIPFTSGKESALKGLYFCGFNVSPTGMLREMGIEARNIAKVLSDARVD